MASLFSKLANSAFTGGKKLLGGNRSNKEDEKNARAYESLYGREWRKVLKEERKKSVKSKKLSKAQEFLSDSIKSDLKKDKIETREENKENKDTPEVEVSNAPLREAKNIKSSLIELKQSLLMMPNNSEISMSISSEMKSTRTILKSQMEVMKEGFKMLAGRKGNIGSGASLSETPASEGKKNESGFSLIGSALSGMMSTIFSPTTLALAGIAASLATLIKLLGGKGEGTEAQGEADKELVSSYKSSASNRIKEARSLLEQFKKEKDKNKKSKLLSSLNKIVAGKNYESINANLNKYEDWFNKESSSRHEGGLAGFMGKLENTWDRLSLPMFDSDTELGRLSKERDEKLNELYSGKSTTPTTASPTTASPTPTTSQGILKINNPKGIAARTNNPGNITYTEWTKKNLGAQDSGIPLIDSSGKKIGTYARFNSNEEGLQALDKLLRSDIYNKLTLGQAGQKYIGAGAIVNNQLNRNYFKDLGDPNTPMSEIIKDPQKMFNLKRGIAKFENSSELLPSIPEVTVDEETKSSPDKEAKSPTASNVNMMQGGSNYSNYSTNIFNSIDRNADHFIGV